MLNLIHGDCLDVMKTLPDASIDAIITDPPYGTTACKWDSVIPFEPMWEQLNRIIKDNGAIALFGSQPFTSALIMSNAKMFKYEWIWEKTMTSNFCQAKYQPMKYHENILIFAKNKTIYNPIMEDRSEIGKKRLKNNGKIISGKNNITKIINFQKKQGEYKQYDPNKIYPKSIQKFNSVPNCNGIKLHPTQKPVALLEYLVKTYTQENETVLDFTMGSGTTGVACKNLNRNFIGIELDEGYFKIAKDRIESHNVVEQKQKSML